MATSTELGQDAQGATLPDDLEDAREHLAATTEILASMGRSDSDIDTVLSAVVGSARRLCRADTAQIYLLEGGAFRIAVATGVSEEYLRYLVEHPIVADRGTLAGRVALDRRAQQIADVLADPEYGRPDVQRMGGFRTTLGIPMLAGDDVVGVLSLWRTEVDPFSDRAVALLSTFAAEAAIAIRNVDLLQQLRSRSTELATKVEQLEALRDVGRAVSSSLDLDEVLTTIVTHAVQLTDSDGGSLLELDGDARLFGLRAVYGTSDSLLEDLRRTRVGLDDTLVGLACLRGQPQSVRDLDHAKPDPHLSLLRGAGWRSVLAVPMLHETGVVGALVVRRRTAGDFSSGTIELLQTFASQSALAIVNARLFTELERKSAELQVASGHKSEFLANMSHELRTPLNAVIGFSEVLLQRMFGELNERQEEYLRDILGSGRHLLELLNDILDLSKVEAGRMVLEPYAFAVRPALDASLALVRERAVRHGIVLHLDVAPDVVEVECDELRFKQVVLNLLSNAVKFSPEGGRVTVRADVAGDALCVTVTDEGIGVAPEDQERIFDSFQQAGPVRGNHEGTGLGLTLCRRLVQLFGGRMWLDSQLGRGSTFGFSVPMTTASPAGPGPSTGPVVVVVEDDRRSLELTTLYLTGAGVQTVPARDAVEGLAAVRQHQPDAVLLDIRLPGPDGWHVLRELKGDPATADTPVVVVTMLDERHRALSMGASEYLVKPVARDEVLGALRAVGVLPAPAVASGSDR